MIFEDLNKRYSPEVIKLICDYFEQLEKLDLLPEGMTIDHCWEYIKSELKDIIFFKTEDQYKYEEIRDAGDKFKGCSSPNNILYVRDGLKDSEIVFYHELTHLLQGSGMKFINDGKLRGFLENEVVTQWVTDRVYMSKYGLSLQVQEYDSSELRMLPGITIKSYLTNYQHFDYLFSKLVDAIGVTQEEVIRLSFYGDEDKVKEFWESNDFLVDGDLFKFMQYIYAADRVIYIGKELLLEEGKSINYNNYDNEIFHLSAQHEREIYNYLINEVLEEIKDEKRSI